MIDKVRKFLFHLRVQSLYIKENQSMRILFSVCFIVLFIYVIIRQLTKYNKSIRSSYSNFYLYTFAVTSGYERTQSL